MMARLRKRTHIILAAHQHEDRASTIMDISIMVLIILNVLAIMLESVAAVKMQWGDTLHQFELYSIAVF